MTKYKLDEDKINIINGIVIVLLLSYFLMSYSCSGLYNILCHVGDVVAAVAVVFLFLININQIYKEDKKVILFVLPSVIILSVLCRIVTNTGFGSILQFISLIIMLVTINKIKMPDIFIKIMEVILVICLAIFCAVSKNHLNPNFVGYIYLFYYLFEVAFNDFKSPKKIIIHSIFSILIGYLLYTTNCRSVLIGFLLINVILLVTKANMYNKKSLGRVLFIILIVGNIVFSSVYVILWKNAVEIEKLPFNDKSIYSGRNRLWYEAFNSIYKNPIFGVGSKYELQANSGEALHNLVLTIPFTFGIPAFGIFAFCLYRFIMAIVKKNMIDINKKRLLSIIAVYFIVEYFENYIYWSRFSLLFLFTVIYIINKDVMNRKKQAINVNERKLQGAKNKIYIFEEGIDRMGGVERVVSTLANAFSNENDVTVVSLYKTKENPFFNYSDKVVRKYLVNKVEKVYNIKTEKKFHYLLMIKTKLIEYLVLNNRLKNYIRGIDKNSILIFGRVDVALKILPHINGCNKVIVRDAIHLAYQKQRRVRMIRKLFPKKVDLLIVSSDESKQKYKEVIGDNLNIRKIYNPLGICPKIGGSLDYKTLIAVGRYTSQKGFDNLLKAFKLVNAKHKDWSLKIVGNNDMLIPELDKLGIKDKVVIEKSTSDVVSILNQASIYVMTSRTEGYANALVEALACGLPSISYNWLMGCEEIINDGENGKIVKLTDRYSYANGIDDERDVVNLANAINSLIEDEDAYKKYHENAPKIIESRAEQTIISEWIKEINK